MSQQIARHTAVVLAGMASIGLTVAAGAYIVHQMASDQRDEAVRHARIAPGLSAPDGQSAERAFAPDLPAVTVRFTAEARVFPAAADIPRPAAPVAPPRPPVAPTAAVVQTNPGVGGRLPLLGDAYVGANLIRTEPDSLSMTVDTNLFTALTARSGASGAQVGDTRVRTDLDVEHGEITLAVSDPALGDHAVRLSPRHTDPASDVHTMPAAPAAPSDPAVAVSV